MKRNKPARRGSYAIQVYEKNQRVLGQPEVIEGEIIDERPYAAVTDFSSEAQKRAQNVTFIKNLQIHHHHSSAPPAPRAVRGTPIKIAKTTKPSQKASNMELVSLSLVLIFAAIGLALCLRALFNIAGV